MQRNHAPHGPFISGRAARPVYETALTQGPVLRDGLAEKPEVSAGTEERPSTAASADDQPQTGLVNRLTLGPTWTLVLC